MTTTEVGELASQLRRWSAAAYETGLACKTRNDRFGMRLAMARAEVYSLAVELARDMFGPKLAALYAQSELAHHVAMQPGAVPLAEADAAFLEHVRAMAWQLCARTVDPAHVPVEKSWR